MSSGDEKHPPEPAAPSRRFGLILWCATFLWFGFFSLLSFDPHHDGVMIVPALDVAAGKVIFRDTFSQYGALVHWIQGAAVRLFGPELAVLKLLTAAVYGLVAVWIDRMWTPLLGSARYRWINLALFFMLAPFYLVPFHPWSSVYALFFMVLAGERMRRFTETGSCRVLAVSGVAGAAAFLCRTPCGAVALLAGLAVLALRWICAPVPRRTALREGASYLGAFAAVGALFGLYLTAVGAWPHYLRQCYGFVGGFVVVRGGSWSWEQFGDSMFPVLTSAGYLDSVFALLPLVSLLLLFLALRPLFYGRRDAVAKALPLISLLLLGLGSWHQYFPVPCVRHLSWAAVPMFGAFALLLRKIGKTPWPRRAKVLLTGGLLFFVLMAFAPRANGIFMRFYTLPKRTACDLPGMRGMLLYKGEYTICRALNELFFSLPPEVQARGVFNHTPDGIYSLLLPRAAFVHPMYVNWGRDVYRNYPDAAWKFILSTRPAVLSSQLDAIPGYEVLFVFTWHGKPYRLFAPQTLPGGGS